MNIAQVFSMPRSLCVPVRPVQYFSEKQQAALRVVMKGRISGRTLECLSAVELFQLARLPAYQEELRKLSA